MNRARGSDLPRVTNARRHAATLAHAPKTDVSSAGSLPDPLRHANSGWHAGAAVRLLCEPLEPRTLLAADPLTSLTAGSEQVSLIGDPDPDLAGAAAAHKITLARGGYLDISLAPPTGGIPGDRQLQLRDVAGTLVATSVEGPKGVKLSQYLPEGTYGLSLAAPRGAVGTCSIVRTVAEPPGPLSSGTSPIDVVIDDMNGDHVPDVVAFHNSDDRQLAVFLGIPDVTGKPTGRFLPKIVSSVDGSALASAFGPIGVPASAGGRASLGAVTVRNDFSMGFFDRKVLLSIATSDAEGRFFTVQSLTLGAAVQVDKLALADVDGDGVSDILLWQQQARNDPPADAYLTILWGGSDGLFSADRSTAIPIDRLTTAVLVADVTGEGHADIITAEALEDNVADAGRVGMIVGPSDWRTADPAALPRATTPIRGFVPDRFSAADLDRDGRLDIIVSGFVSASGGTAGGVAVVSSLVGAGSTPGLVAAASMPLASYPRNLAVADTDRDGLIDVVTADGGANTVSVLKGDGRGGIGVPIAWQAGGGPAAVALADIDGDGRIDIATADPNSGTVSILSQRPDGSYPGTRRAEVGDGCKQSATADFNGDGRIDVVTANLGSGDISVLLGAGDGSFLPQRRYPVGAEPYALAVGDLNRDGRVDIVVVRLWESSFTVLLGLGDGSFDRQRDFPVDGYPRDVVVSDMDGDGWNDIVICSTRDDGQPGHVTVAYAAAVEAAYSRRFTRPLGLNTSGMAVADVTGDGRRDLVVLDQGDGSPEHLSRLAILPGAAEGTPAATQFAATQFAATQWVELGGQAFGMTAVSLPGGGPAGIAVAMTAEHRWFIATFARNASSTLVEQGRVFLPEDKSLAHESPVVAADIDGDGQDDIVVAVDSLTGSSADQALMLSSRDGFTTSFPIAGGRSPLGITVADLDGDGRNDLLFTNGVSPLVATLNLPDGMFAPVGDGTFADKIAPRVVPVPAGAGFPGGTAALDRGGAIRIRLDAGGTPILAAGAGTAFDLAVVSSGAGSATIATIDGDRRGVSLREVRRDGSLGPARSLALPSLRDRQPVLSRISAADLDRDGSDDLIVSDPGRGVIWVLPAGSDGSFRATAWQTYATGAGGSRFTLADVSGDGRLDLLVANQVAGDVSVRQGLAAAAAGSPLFGPERRFRATLREAAFAVDPLTGRSTAVSPAPIDDVAAADVDGDGLPDIIVTSAADRAFAILAGLPGGGFAAPRVHLPHVVAGPGPLLVTRAAAPDGIVVGDFDADGDADLAMLDRTHAEILVYRSTDGRPSVGRRAAPDFDGLLTPIPLAGGLPTSLRAADLASPSGGPDGVEDLVVGNDYGDVLVLPGQTDARGRGTGQFARGLRADRGVALVATDIDGDGATDFIYGDRSLDRVTVSAGTDAAMFAADRALGVLGPSAVATVPETVGGRRLANLVVANGAGNEVLVFPRNAGEGDAFLAPRRVFVGTNPTGIVIADVNGDRAADAVVTNGGSGDISILLGATGADGRWTLVAGPRIAAGGANPSSLAVADFVRADGSPGADGIPDIAVTGRNSSQVRLIPGVGAGFFAEAAIRGLDLPAAATPIALFAMPRGGGGAGLVAVNSGTGSISSFDGGRGFLRTDTNAGGGTPRAAAVTSQGGSTVLAVANAGTGNLSVFLSSPGSSAFASVASYASAQTAANSSALAFDASGRLYGTAGGLSSPLELYSFTPATAGPGVTAESLRALINFLPSQFSSVGLVATLVTSAGIQVAAEGATSGSTPRGQAAGGKPVDGESLGGQGEADEPVADAAAPESEVAETDLSPVMRLFLDAEATLRATNSRLIESLLSQADDPLALLSGAVAAISAATADRQSSGQSGASAANGSAASTRQAAAAPAAFASGSRRSAEDGEVPAISGPSSDRERTAVSNTPATAITGRSERFAALDPHGLGPPDTVLSPATSHSVRPAAWSQAHGNARNGDAAAPALGSLRHTGGGISIAGPADTATPPALRPAARLLDAVFAIVGGMLDHHSTAPAR